MWWRHQACETPKRRHQLLTTECPVTVRRSNLGDPELRLVEKWRRRRASRNVTSSWGLRWSSVTMLSRKWTTLALKWSDGPDRVTLSSSDLVFRNVSDGSQPARSPYQWIQMCAIRAITSPRRWLSRSHSATTDLFLSRKLELHSFYGGFLRWNVLLFLYKRRRRYC